MARGEIDFMLKNCILLNKFSAVVRNQNRRVMGATLLLRHYAPFFEKTAILKIDG